MKYVYTEDENKVLNIFKKYGEIEFIQVKNGIKAFLFSCDVKKVIEYSILQKLSKIILILQIGNDDVAILYLFCIYKKQQYNADIMDCINKVNSKIRHGKFYIDDDGDVNWNSSFDIKIANEIMIKNILDSMLDGILMLVLEVRQDEKK